MARGPHYENGQLLKTHLKAQRHDIAWAADQLGVSPETIYKIHNGESWNLGNIHNYLEALNLPTDTFGGTPEDRPAAEKRDAALAIFADLPNDVQLGLVVYGKWLAENYPAADARFVKLAALSELMNRD
jgi:hypothetical protein